MKWLIYGAVAAFGAIVFRKLTNIQKEIRSMSSNVSKITDLSDKIAQDVENIKRNQEKLAQDKAALQTVIDDQKATIADLQSKLAQGALDEAALSAAAEKLTKADADLDAIEPDQLPAPVPEPTSGSGSTGGEVSTSPAETPASGTGTTSGETPAEIAPGVTETPAESVPQG